MARSGLTLVEVIIALGILLLIVISTVTSFDDLIGSAKDKSARADLDVIRGEIERWQVEHRKDYPLLEIPYRDGSPPKDPWGVPYRISARTRTVYSCGANGVDDGGGGDDIGLGYDAYRSDELKPPLDLHVSAKGDGWVELAWSPVAYAGGLTGYNVYRRESFSQSTFTTVPINPEPIATAPAPVFKDVNLAPGKVYYYSLEVVGADGVKARAPNPLGFRTVTAVPPKVEIDPAAVTVFVGQSVSFTVRAQGFGVGIARITVDGSPQKFVPGVPVVTVEKTYSIAGEYPVQVEVTDDAGSVSAVSAKVLVRK